MDDVQIVHTVLCQNESSSASHMTEHTVQPSLLVFIKSGTYFQSCFFFSPLQVKVWFQNRRMKWKRVKGGQQGAVAREKELVHVKKGTLLPSEFSGIVGLHHRPDSLMNEDSHDSDQSSEHAHL